MLPVPEVLWLWGALAGYSAGTVAAWRAGPGSGAPAADARVLGALALAVALLALAVAQRWLRLGYGPVLTLFEILLSNLFSLGLVYALIFWRVPAARSGAAAVLPALLVLGAWNLGESPQPGRLPATFANPWLWVHVGTGKLFLGACLGAAGLAGALLAGNRRARAESEAADAAAWRLLAFAFVFQTLMIVAGAAWARDAWGRFWAWDPLETWSFVTWLVAGALLHARVTWRLPPAAGWWGIVLVFALAVLTFLGVPFVSVAAHKGVM